MSTNSTPPVKPSTEHPATPSASSGDSLPADVQADIERIAKMAQEHARNVLKKVPVLGPVVWLMMTNNMTRHTLLSELEWRVMPALVLDQAKLYFREEAPVAFASWAKLSDAAAQRYRTPPHHLAASDWNSGQQIWLVDVLTPFGGAQEVLQDLREKVFAGHEVHQLLPNGGAEAKVLTWPVA